MKKLLILLCLPMLFSSCYLQNEEQKALTEICENINSACPMMVKDNFEFTSINCRYPKVEMSYRYTDYESNDIYNEVMKALAKKEAEDPINNNEGFSDFREAGYMFVMLYFDKNYKSIFHLLLMKDTDGLYKLIDEPKDEESEINTEDNSLEKEWNKFHKLEFEKPIGWFDNTDKPLKDLVEAVNYSDSVKEYILKRESENLVLARFTKYDPENYVGYIPTIHIVQRDNPYTNHKDFRNFCVNQVESFKTIFNNYKLEGERVYNIELDGLNGYAFKSSYEVSLEDEMIKTKSWVYVVPVGKYFYQISFTAPESDDSHQLFLSFSKSIKFKK